jgi:hypothetical protein
MSSIKRRTRAAWWCAAVLWSACFPRAYDHLALAEVAYTGGPARVFASPCLNVGVRLAEDPLVPPDSPVVQYELGSRCMRATSIDLRAMAVSAVCRDGRRAALAAYDPRRELRSVRLEPSFDVFEAVAYEHVDRTTQCEIRAVCFAPSRAGEAPFQPEGACLPFDPASTQERARRGFR